MTVADAVVEERVRCSAWWDGKKLKYWGTFRLPQQLQLKTGPSLIKAIYNLHMLLGASSLNNVCPSRLETRVGAEWVNTG